MQISLELGRHHAKISVEDVCLLGERPSSPQIRILIVEDHERFRRYLCATLAEQTNLKVVGESEDGLQGVQQAEALQPDVILLDIGLPGMNGMEAARQICKFAPNAKIIFVTQEFSPEVVEEAFNLGARGYVLKAQAQSELLAAIDAVSSGLRFVSSGLDGRGTPPERSPR